MSTGDLAVKLIQLMTKNCEWNILQHWLNKHFLCAADFFLQLGSCKEAVR